MTVREVCLTIQQRKHLEQFTTTGVHKAREIMRARLMLKYDEGLTDTEVAAVVGVTKKNDLEGSESGRFGLNQAIIDFIPYRQGARAVFHIDRVHERYERKVPNASQVNAFLR